MDNSPRQNPDPVSSLLLVVAHGVGRSALTALRGQTGMPPRAIDLEHGPMTLPDLLAGCCDAAPQLGEFGVAVERRSLTLRSRNTCDDTAVASLGARPTGPAPVSILQLCDVLVAAATGGAAAVPAAIGRLAGHVENAAARVQAGASTEVWLVGLGDLQPVDTMFDFRAAFRRSKIAPIAAELPLQVQSGCVTIRPQSATAHDMALHVLSGPEFKSHGSIEESWRDGLRFLAAEGVAFSSRRQIVRAPNPGEAAPHALVPNAIRTGEIDQDVRQLLARFWMRAARHAELREAVPAPTTTTAPSMPVDSVRSPLVEPTADPARSRSR